MNYRKFISALISVSLLCGAVPFSSAAEDTTDVPYLLVDEVSIDELTVNPEAADGKYTVTVFDFDGNIIDKLSIAEGEKPDLSSVDTSRLEKHLDVYTQIGFSSWSSIPEKITEDISVYALYRKMTLSLESMPSRTEYYSDNGNISLEGLKVTINVETQLPEKDGSGNFKTESSVADISRYCTASPSNLSEAFSQDDKSTVNVYPVGSDKPLLSYDINFYRNLGDTNMDGKIDASDASFVLNAYSAASTGNPISYAAGQKKRCDIDFNSIIDASDASFILSYYAQASISENPSWEIFLFPENNQ